MFTSHTKRLQGWRRVGVGGSCHLVAKSLLLCQLSSNHKPNKTGYDKCKDCVGEPIASVPE